MPESNLTTGPGATQSLPAKARTGFAARVVVAACPAYSPVEVGAAIDEALAALGGLTAFIRPGNTVLLKPNLFRSRPPDTAIITHPEIVRQVALRCQKAGAARIWVGDSITSGLSEAEHWSRTGLVTALDGLPVELKSWACRQIPLACGRFWLPIPDWYREVDAVISLPKLKTHSLTVMSCAVKNLYGLVGGHAKTQLHLRHPSTGEMSAFLAEVYAALKPRLSIADAVIALEGNGPASGRPRPVGAILASEDAIALDAVACRALGIRPASVPLLRIAAGRGSGCLDETRIECLGSGLSLLSTVRLKPSLATFVRLIPPWACVLTPLLFSLRPQPRPGQCARCGLCVQACPRQAISLPPNASAPAVDRKACVSCLCCIGSCPQDAIAIGLHVGPLCLAKFGRRSWYPR